MRIAAFPWYELPETAAAREALWSAVARRLRKGGLSGVPGRLTRGLPVPALFADPRLLVGQCCGYDLIYGFASSLKLVATPCYRAPGCEGSDYRSLVLVRDDCPADALEGLRGMVCVANSFNSHSGTNALRGLVAPFSREGRFFSAVKVSGAHVKSLALVRAGKADVMAMDCVLHALLVLHRPQALRGTRVLCRSDPAPAPPFVTSSGTDAKTIALLRRALAEALDEGVNADAKAALLLDGIALVPLQDYARIVVMEGRALGHGYLELHATSPVLAGSGRKRG